jgi:hypothetical protein
LHKLAHAVLNGLDDVRLKLGERVLDTDQILSVVILLQDLLIQAIHDATLKNIWVVRSFHIAAVRVEHCCVLTE